jgi:hypothetical protein
MLFRGGVVAWVSVTLVCWGCGSGSVNDGGTTYELFALEPATVIVRPYMCETVTMKVKSEPPTDPASIEWSANAALEVRPVSTLQGGASSAAQSTVKLCAGGASGRFTFKAQLAGQEGYFADGTVTVGLPTLAPQPTDETSPIADILGPATKDFLRIGWESDTVIWAVSSDSSVLRFDARTLQPRGAFFVPGLTDAVPMGNGKWFLRLRKASNALYDERTRTMESWFDSLGLDELNGHTQGPYEVVRGNDVVASSWAANRAVSWLEGDDQNAQVCRMTLLDLAANRRDPFNWSFGSIGRPMNEFRPETYVELSADGKYVAFGVGGCSPSMPADGLYDVAAKRAVSCGDDERRSWSPRPVFSANGTALVKVEANGSLSVFDVPSCMRRGKNPVGGGHVGFALAPDGQTLARAVDAVGGVQLLFYDVRSGTTLPTGEFRTTRGFVAPIPGYDGTQFIVPVSTRLAFSPSGTKLAVGLPSGRVSVVDLSKPDAQAVTNDDEQVAGLIFKTWLSPNKRYLGLHAKDLDYGVYDLNDKRLVMRLPEILAIDDTRVIVNDRVALRTRFSTFANPGVLEDFIGPLPMPPVEANACVVRDAGNTVCHVGATERCVDVMAKTQRKALDATDTGLACAILTSDSLWQWAPGTTTVSRAAHLATPFPTQSQIPIEARLRALPNGRYLVPTSRLEVWKP